MDGAQEIPADLEWVYSYDKEPLVVPDIPDNAEEPLCFVVVERESSGKQTTILVTTRAATASIVNRRTPQLWFSLPRTILLRKFDGLSGL